MSFQWQRSKSRHEFYQLRWLVMLGKGRIFWHHETYIFCLMQSSLSAIASYVQWLLSLCYLSTQRWVPIGLAIDFEKVTTGLVLTRSRCCQPNLPERWHATADNNSCQAACVTWSLVHHGYFFCVCVSGKGEEYSGRSCECVTSELLATIGRHAA